MSYRITPWKCRKCFGTGRVIYGVGEHKRAIECEDCDGTGRVIYGVGEHKRAIECEDCDGTGNALVDGAAERHKRKLAALDAITTERRHERD